MASLLWWPYPLVAISIQIVEENDYHIKYFEMATCYVNHGSPIELRHATLSSIIVILGRMFLFIHNFFHFTAQYDSNPRSSQYPGKIAQKEKNDQSENTEANLLRSFEASLNE
jgi:hypothetical protein